MNDRKMDGLGKKEGELWYFQSFLWSVASSWYLISLAEEKSQEFSTQREDVIEIYSSGLMDLGEGSFG